MYSTLKPAFRVTWYSSTLPAATRPRRSPTSNHEIPRTVWLASRMALPTASAKDFFDVPTSVISLYVEGMAISPIA